MRKPSFGKPRAASGGFSLSRKLPRLRMPLSAAEVPAQRPRPQMGKPGVPAPAPRPPKGGAPPTTAPQAGEAACARCGHGESGHPVRYVCDKYPHPDPLQICGCESEHLDDPCTTCGHTARHHKPRHRCRAAGDACHCWGFTDQ
ncbi:MAG TPA: hypothetical protein VGR02_18745 [Thermoanaerobaculia bacterium]|jgi:hypothetical protein|nr:hypothetical protein [Thermoanaerobaculia bacterium]